MNQINSKPRRGGGGPTVLPQVGDHASLEAAMLHLAQQQTGPSPSRTTSTARQSASPDAAPSTQGVTPAPGQVVDLDPINAAIATMQAQILALQGSTGVSPFGAFTVGAQALAMGMVVRIESGVAQVVKSTDIDRPIISGITMEAGSPGQTIQVGIMAGVRYTLASGIPAPTGVLFLGPDGKLTAAPPTSGWLISMGHAESPTIFFMDPDLAILRS